MYVYLIVAKSAKMVMNEVETKCVCLYGLRLKYQFPPASVVLCAETYQSVCDDGIPVTTAKVLVVVLLLLLLSVIC